MNTEKMNTEKWAAIVALTVFVLFGAIILSAIFRYETAEEAMRVFAGLWGAFGAGIGLLFGYFFTRGPMMEAKEMSDKAMGKADKAMNMTHELKTEMANLRPK